MGKNKSKALLLFGDLRSSPLKYLETRWNQHETQTRSIFLHIFAKWASNFSRTRRGSCQILLGGLQSPHRISQPYTASRFPRSSGEYMWILVHIPILWSNMTGQFIFFLGFRGNMGKLEAWYWIPLNPLSWYLATLCPCSLAWPFSCHHEGLLSTSPAHFPRPCWNDGQRPSRVPKSCLVLAFKQQTAAFSRCN